MKLQLSVYDYINKRQSLQWRHNGRDGVSNHRRLLCLLNFWFRRISQKTSKLRVTGLYEGNSPVTDKFPGQKASKVEMFPFDAVIMLNYMHLHRAICMQFWNKQSPVMLSEHWGRSIASDNIIGLDVHFPSVLAQLQYNKLVTRAFPDRSVYL